MEQLKTQTECEIQLILLAVLSQWISDKAAHLRLCQHTASAETERTQDPQCPRPLNLTIVF